MIYVWGSGLADAKSAEEAEYERLLSEMTKFSKTQSWMGVNKRFAEMEKLGLEIGVNELLMAAQASQGLGDIYQAKERVSRALLLKEKKSTRNWYTQLNNDYGQVTLVARNKGARTLEQLQMTMDPVHGRAIVFAQECLESKGSFEGYCFHWRIQLWWTRVNCQRGYGYPSRDFTQIETETHKSTSRLTLEKRSPRER